MLNTVLASAAIALALQAPAPVIDGQFDDWDDAHQVEDPGDDAAPAVDLRSVLWRRDEHGLWLALETALAANLVHADRTMAVLIDNAAGGLAFGAMTGVDQVVEFAPLQRDHGARFGARVGIAGGRGWRYDGVHTVGLVSAPTFAASRFELLLGRLALPPGSRLALMLSDDAGHDVVPWFDVDSRTITRSRPAIAVVRPADNVLRVLSWNVGDHGIMGEGATLRTLVQATDPDVVMLDEVPPEADRQWITRWLPGQPWTVHQGTSGGRQRQIIAARNPLEPVAAFARLRYTAGDRTRIGREGSTAMQRDLNRAGGDTVPVSGAILTWNGQKVLLVSADLQCCGRAGSIHDWTRQRQVALIVPLIRQVLESGRAQHVILGADLNLVGSRRPLQLLEQAGLKAVDALQPHGLANATWSNPREVFPPGRLDFVLHSGAVGVHSAVVFNPAAMTARQLRSVGIRADVLGSLSEHQPLVVNFTPGLPPADGENSAPDDR